MDNKMIREMQDAGYDDCRNNCIGEARDQVFVGQAPGDDNRRYPEHLEGLWIRRIRRLLGGSDRRESWQDFSKALERDPNYTNDPSSEGTPGQAKGSEYDLSDDMPAMFGGYTFVGVFVSFCCLVKLGLMARSLLTSRRAGSGVHQCCLGSLRELERRRVYIKRLGDVVILFNIQTHLFFSLIPTALQYTVRYSSWDLEFYAPFLTETHRNVIIYTVFAQGSLMCHHLVAGTRIDSTRSVCHGVSNTPARAPSGAMTSSLTHSAFRLGGSHAGFRTRCASKTPRAFARTSLVVRNEGTGRFIVGGNWKCNGNR